MELNTEPKWGTVRKKVTHISTIVQTTVSKKWKKEKKRLEMSAQG